MDLPAFDELMDLAKRDPEGFEKLRTELIEDFISRSPERHHGRLRGLQFVIDARRRATRSPMKALLDIQAMMHDSLLSLQQALRGCQSPSEPTAPICGQVLQFRRSSASV